MSIHSVKKIIKKVYKKALTNYLKRCILYSTKQRNTLKRVKELIKMFKLNDTFERGGCLWIVENVYTTDNPELYYKERVTVRCIRSNPSANGYKVGDKLDYANV